MSSNYSQGWFWGNAVGKSEASPKCTQRIVLSLKVPNPYFISSLDVLCQGSKFGALGCGLSCRRSWRLCLKYLHKSCCLLAHMCSCQTALVCRPLKMQKLCPCPHKKTQKTKMKMYSSILQKTAADSHQHTYLTYILFFCSIKGNCSKEGMTPNSPC